MASLKTIKNDAILHAKRIVIKIGSSLIINNKTGNLDNQWMDALAENIDFLNIKIAKEFWDKLKNNNLIDERSPTPN